MYRVECLPVGELCRTATETTVDPSLPCCSSFMRGIFRPGRCTVANTGTLTATPCPQPRKHSEHPPPPNCKLSASLPVLLHIAEEWKTIHLGTF